MDTRFVLDDVPPITGYEHADTFLDALSIALCYQEPGLAERLKPHVFDCLSGFTGRGWLVGWDDAQYYWERHGPSRPRPNFACSSLEALLSHCDTLRDAFRFVERAPEFLWNQSCTYSVEPARAAEFIAMSETVDASGVRHYVHERLTSRHCPVIALLYHPGADQVDSALLTGYGSGGDVILGRSLLQNVAMDNSGEFGYFRLPDWERHVVALIGIGGEAKTEWEKDPCFIAVGNGLKCGRTYSNGTRHYGLAAYDAWERALLDDESLNGADDDLVARRLQCHSLFAGAFACQKAFTVLPECDAPGMCLIDGNVRRAQAGVVMIHGLMWDAWQVVGGYWRMTKESDAAEGGTWKGTGEIARFRDRAVRERAASVVRRARRTDEETFRFLAEAREDWDRCRGHGKAYPCPCWGTQGCART